MDNDSTGTRQLSAFANRQDCNSLPTNPTPLGENSMSSESPRPQLHRPHSQPIQPMHDWQKHILIDNSALMKRHIRFNECMIFHDLYAQHVLTEDNFETLTNTNLRPCDQVHKFLVILQHKGEAAYYRFLNALKQDESYEYIWQKLNDDEEQYHGSNGLSRCQSSYTTHVSTKSIDEQLYIDERSNTYVVCMSTFVPVVMESKIPGMKKRLFDLYSSTAGSSNYEEIPAIPIQENDKRSIDTLPQSSGDVRLTVHDILQVDFEPKEAQIEKEEQLFLSTYLTNLLVNACDTEEYGLAYNAQRNLLVVEFSNLKAYGDLSQELWYYPTPVSSKQITDWLSGYRIQGCFYVYESNNSDGTDNVAYNIGICHNASGDVIHYRIVRNEANELQIGDVKNNRGMKFDSIQNLVKYFRGTRGCLECRLRWSPPELTEKLILNWTIPVDKLEFQDMIACHSDGNHTSEVFKGVYSGRKVAIKQPAKLSQNKLEEDNFLMEARIVGKLAHDNITRFEGICYLRGACHLVLEYAENSDLRSCLRKCLIDPANIRSTLKLWMQLLDALAYMKDEKYIIHRDIAARNCLIHDLRILKLSDFGMAAKVEQHDEFIPDKDDSFSYRWAAPEVFTKRCFSTMSDIWSAGVVFWEMATGAKDIPYKDLKENGKVQRKVTNGRKLAYSDDMNKAYKVPMKEIVVKCWRKEPRERPAAKDLLHCCNKFMNTLDGGDNLYDSMEPMDMEKSSSFRNIKGKFKIKK